VQYFNNQNRSLNLYFHRWSNKSFAVFQSIGKELIIGVISTILDNLKTVKSALKSIIKIRIDDQMSWDDNDELLSESTLIDFYFLNECPLSLLLNESSNESYSIAGTVIKSRKYYINKAYRWPFSIFPVSLNRFSFNKPPKLFYSP
jgi:hypothetical protein